MATKRFTVYVNTPPNAYDVQVMELLQRAPATLRVQLTLYGCPPEQFHQLPPMVQRGGMPALYDAQAKEFAPPGAETVRIMGQLVRSAMDMEQSQQQVRSAVMRSAEAFAPPDPSRGRAVGPTPGPQYAPQYPPQYSPQYPPQYPPQYSHAPPAPPPPAASYLAGMQSYSDRAEGGGRFASARERVDTHMPQPSQYQQQGRPAGATAQAPPSDSLPPESTLGPRGTIGGGMGIPGGTMGFGRPGFGLGTDINLSCLQSADVKMPDNVASQTLDMMFGGTKTGYNISQGRVPPYLQGAKVTGASLEYEHGRKEGPISQQAVDDLAALRKQTEQQFQQSWTPGATVEQQKDVGSGSAGADVRQLMKARASQIGAGPSAGLTPEPIRMIDDSLTSKMGLHSVGPGQSPLSQYGGGAPMPQQQQPQYAGGPPMGMPQYGQQQGQYGQQQGPPMPQYGQQQGPPMGMPQYGQQQGPPMGMPQYGQQQGPPMPQYGQQQQQPHGFDPASSMMSDRVKPVMPTIFDGRPPVTASNTGLPMPGMSSGMMSMGRMGF